MHQMPVQITEMVEMVITAEAAETATEAAEMADQEEWMILLIGQINALLGNKKELQAAHV